MTTENGDLKKRMRDFGLNPPPDKSEGDDTQMDWVVETLSLLAADVHELKEHKTWKKFISRSAKIFAVLSGLSVGVYYIVSTVKLLTE